MMRLNNLIKRNSSVEVNKRVDISSVYKQDKGTSKYILRFLKKLSSSVKLQQLDELIESITDTGYCSLVFDIEYTKKGRFLVEIALKKVGFEHLNGGILLKSTNTGIEISEILDYPESSEVYDVPEPLYLELFEVISTNAIINAG